MQPVCAVPRLCSHLVLGEVSECRVDDDHGWRRLDLAQDGQSVALWHREVEQYDIDRSLTQQVKCHFTIFGFDDAVPVGFEEEAGPKSSHQCHPPLRARSWERPCRRVQMMSCPRRAHWQQTRRCPLAPGAAVPKKIDIRPRVCTVLDGSEVEKLHQRADRLGLAGPSGHALPLGPYHPSSGRPPDTTSTSSEDPMSGSVRVIIGKVWAVQVP